MYGLEVINSGGVIQLTGREAGYAVRTVASVNTANITENGYVYGNVVDLPSSVFANGSLLFMRPPGGVGNIRYLCMTPYVSGKVRLQASTVGTHNYVVVSVNPSTSPINGFGLHMSNINGLGTSFDSNESYLAITQQIKIPISTSTGNSSGSIPITTAPYVGKLPYFSAPSPYGLYLWTGNGDNYLTFIVTLNVSGNTLNYTLTRSGPSVVTSGTIKETTAVFQIVVGVLT